ncbi:DUF7322 domain-containing protein [Halovivax gelatinilyticus]|uniref:DUF7322 domain-containing protein n=1 Tax=Halovivax gelatinilyticus TaxID=2961597 RepID=UPI0020CA5EE0|nr:CAAX protease family protein [Halovivax gelatinilyticus]
MGNDDFDLDPSAHEPDEWDPESDLHDPAADGLTIPSVSTDESDAPKEVVQAFWSVVLIVNVAVLFVSLGPMLVYFLGWYQRGFALIAGGIVLFGLAYRRYRRFMRESESNANIESLSSDPGDPDTAPASAEETTIDDESDTQQ